MEFTNEQKTAIIRLSKAMVEADGKISVKEPQKMDEVLKGLGFQTKEEQMRVLASARDMGLRKVAEIVSKLSTDGKVYVTTLLRSIMEVYGDTDDKELALLRFVSSLCDLPRQEAA